MNSLRRVSTVFRTVGARQLETTSNIQPGYDKVRKTQELFQMADGNLVHEKTRADRFFFYITTALTIAGALGSLEYFYRSSFPKRA